MVASASKSSGSDKREVQWKQVHHSAQVVTRGKNNGRIWVTRKVSTFGSINVSANESTVQILLTG